MPRASHGTVLVVDDDPDLLDLIAFVLESDGFQVLTASDGRAALKVVQETMPDLILLDMKMPVMNGWEFAAEFQRRHGDAAPIAVVTAAENAEKRAEEIGAAAWVSKPFDVAVLAKVVHRFKKS